MHGNHNQLHLNYLTVDKRYTYDFLKGHCCIYLIQYSACDWKGETLT